MKSFISLFTLITSILLLQACEDDLDPTKEAINSLTFRQIMQLSKFAAAENISVSPNGQYMIFSYQENVSIKQYYSNDGGQTAHELFVYGNAAELPIQTSISNDGKFVMSDGGLYDLNNISSGSAAVFYATGVTTSGKMVYIQNDGANGKTFFIANNDNYESTGVGLTIDERYYLGTVGEKMGFFDHTTKTIAEYDVATNTYTQHTLTLDYGLIGGFGQYEGEIQTAYSEGYFVYAKSGGLLIISPSLEVTYYTYPPMSASYYNTVKLRLFKDKAYVELIDGNTYLAYNGNINQSDLAFPIEMVGNDIYTQGFLENSDRLKSGIIKISGTSKEYLPMDFPFDFLGSRRFETVQVIGDYAYTADKVFNINNKTYASSLIGEIISVYFDSDKTIAYTSNGTYTTTNGINWNLESADQVRPNLVTKDIEGVYHALTKQLQIYVSPGTQAKIYSVDLKGYVSSDGINWQLVPETVTNKGGLGPRLLSSDGTITCLDSNPDTKVLRYISEDYGVSYEAFVNQISLLDSKPLPEDFKVTEFELGNGKFIAVDFEFDGEMTLFVCDRPLGGCTKNVIIPTFDPSEMYTGSDEGDFQTYETITANGEIVFNTLDGIFISSSLK
jgi:hypothetical protein